MNNLFALAKEKVVNGNEKEQFPFQKTVIINVSDVDNIVKDEIIIPQISLESKIKIKLKKNPIIELNSQVKNSSLNIICEEQRCEKILSRNRLHKPETSHKHHKKLYGNGDTEYANVQKKNSTIRRMNRGGYVSGEILKKYDIGKKDITNWEKIRIDVFDLLNINGETLNQQECFKLIRLRPELKERLSVVLIIYQLMKLIK